MHRRVIPVVVLALVSAAALGYAAVGAPPAQAASSGSTYLLRERLCLLQGYIERYANMHYSYYPTVGEVRRGGGLPAPLWPRNPWTGRAMRPGGRVGDYTYRPAADRLSYTLVGRSAGGSIKLRGRVPNTRKMQNDHRTREGLELVRECIETWARGHEGLYPPVASVDAAADVGRHAGLRYWPHNPWFHTNMAQLRRKGDFTYSVSADRTSYAITAHYSRGGSFTLRGDATTSPWLRLLAGLDDEILRRNGRILAGYVDQWSALHSGELPQAAELAPGGAVGAAHAYWPVDPIGDEAMRQGAAPGRYTYVPGAAHAYVLTIHLHSGDFEAGGTAPVPAEPAPRAGPADR